MGTLLEEMRSNPETVVEETIVGVDPDLHQCAFAAVTTRTSSKEATRILAVRVWSLNVHKRYKGAKAIEGMAHLMRELGEHQAGTSVDAVFVEGQRVYPHDDIPRLVGQSNDLIRLAQVAGMALMVFWPKNPERLHIVDPTEWKGQTKKEAMHAQAMRLLRGQQTPTHYYPYDQEYTDDLEILWELTDDDITAKLGIHVMDAVCLALWGVGK